MTDEDEVATPLAVALVVSGIVGKYVLHLGFSAFVLVVAVEALAGAVAVQYTRKRASKSH